LVVLLELRRYVEQFGIITTAVRSYEDKERVQLFLITLQELIADCERRLDAHEREKAEKCEKYKSEGAELEQLIEFEVSRARLDLLRSKLEGLGPIGKRTVPIEVSASVIGCGVIAIVFAAIKGFNPDDSHASVSLVLSYILIPLGILLFRSKTPIPPEVREIQNEIETETRVLEATTGGANPDERRRDLQRKFGEGDPQSYRELAADRDAFVREIMTRAVKPLAP
jgi:hypothetical protein